MCAWPSYTEQIYAIIVSISLSIYATQTQEKDKLLMEYSHFNTKSINDVHLCKARLMLNRQLFDVLRTYV